MNKYDLLFIRACKSKNPTERVKKVYRRFYGNFEKEDEYIF